MIKEVFSVFSLYLVLIPNLFQGRELRETTFLFIGFVNNSLPLTSGLQIRSLADCSAHCLNDDNCYYFHICKEGNVKICFSYNENDTNIHIQENGSCERYKLSGVCEKGLTQTCRCADNFGGERCNQKYDCTGNLVPLNTASYTYFKTTSNGIIRELPCNMITDNGGWTVFQRRFDGSTDFFRNWAEYTSGFGTLDSEFYLGNQILHEIVTNGSFELRIDLEDKTGEWRYAKYSHFSIGGPETFYTLSVTGYTGNASDSFSTHSGMKFSTFDMDNDVYPDPSLNCADYLHGAWWYVTCAASNLNGLYGENSIKGVWWYYWHNTFDHSMKSTQMMVRMIR